VISKQVVQFFSRSVSVLRFNVRCYSGNRHANRRGPPRGLKEMEISPITSDGKPSKRGPASYGAHEV
jgi:hypothetical protein